MTLQLSEHPAIDAVLSTASTLLGMEIVFLGGLTEDTFTFERVHAVAEWPGIAPGVTAEREDTLCHRLLEGAPDRTSAADQHPIYRDAATGLEFGITSYVGVPIRDAGGHVVATLCGIDRGAVEVDDATFAVLQQLADVIAAHLGPMLAEGLVIRRSPEGGWAVGDKQADDLTSAMVLADLLAGSSAPNNRPGKPGAAIDEVAQLRLSVQQLEHALVARVVVEQAIGVLAERRHSSPRQAFERLRQVARARGRKVHDLAREVVASATDPSVPLPNELAGRR